MKKIFLAIAIAATFAGCSKQSEADNAQPISSAVKQEKVLTPAQEFEQHINDLKKKFKRRGSNKDSLQVVYDNYMKEMSIKHQGDSLGLMIVKSMAIDYNSKQLDSVMNICELYRNDSQLQRLAKASVAVEATAVGKRYVDFSGIYPKSEKPFKLSSIVNQGKPVVVNFWASWSIASRDEIRKNIFEYATEYKGKVNFVSVAVWEDSVTFVNRAISELLMEWPVMYTEGRENSPTEAYGVLGIPHVMLIGKDGIIRGRNLRDEEIKAAIEKELRR